MNLRIRILIPLLLGFAASSSAQPGSPCTPFREGRFYYREFRPDAVVIERSAAEQYEYDRSTGHVTRYQVRWTDSCTYELTQVWSNDARINAGNGALIRVHITEVLDNGYLYTAEYNGIVTRYTLLRIPE
ncbi:MAG: hypothetical protein NW241_04200 [Bacteroidia bacterium]|nr:hypothetical protein [Bacteroidia bacterium]